MTRSLFRQTIPRQHGAWSILAAAAALGMVAGGGLRVQGALFAVCVVLGFFAQHTGELWLKFSGSTNRRREIGYLLLAYALTFLLCGAMLLFKYELWGLLPLAGLASGLVALSLTLSKVRKARTVVGEIVNVLALTLVLPAAAYCAAGSYVYPTVGLTLMAAIFFCASIFHVRYLVRGGRRQAGSAPERLRAATPSLAYHALGLVAAGALAAFGLLPIAAPLALLPVTLKALRAAAMPARGPTPIRTIGYVELAHTIVFVLLAALLAVPRSGRGCHTIENEFQLRLCRYSARRPARPAPPPSRAGWVDLHLDATSILSPHSVAAAPGQP